MTDNEYNLRRLAIVLKDSNDAITIQGLNGIIEAWNKGAELLYGYTEKEAVGMHISKLILKEEKDSLKYIEDIAQGNRVPSYETKRLTKNGDIIDVWLVVSCLVDDSGTIDSIATTERDITHIKDELRRKDKEVVVLQGLLPICAHCKNIRDDKGDWKQLEEYITKHSEAGFSHSICPGCAKKHYPEIFSKKKH